MRVIGRGDADFGDCTWRESRRKDRSHFERSDVGFCFDRDLLPSWYVYLTFVMS